LVNDQSGGSTPGGDSGAGAGSGSGAGSGTTPGGDSGFGAGSDTTPGGGSGAGAGSGSETPGGLSDATGTYVANIPTVSLDPVGDSPAQVQADLHTSFVAPAESTNLAT